VIDMPYGPQVLWPTIACRERGAPRWSKASPSIPPSSCCARNPFRRRFLFGVCRGRPQDHDRLGGLLAARGVGRVFVCGLATDFCVAFTALDARAAGFETFVIEDACRAIDADGSLEPRSRVSTRRTCGASPRLRFFPESGPSGDLTRLNWRRAMKARVHSSCCRRVSP